VGEFVVQGEFREDDGREEHDESLDILRGRTGSVLECVGEEDIDLRRRRSVDEERNRVLERRRYFRLEVKLNG
jgi:hypothetical protein